MLLNIHISIFIDTTFFWSFRFCKRSNSEKHHS